MRDFSVATSRFIGENGEVKELECVRLDAQMKPIPGTEFRIPADLVLLAMGFLHPVQEGMVKDLMLDLDQRGRDIRCFVHALEGWLIASLADLGVDARREPGRIGLWIGSGKGEAKIAAIGVRVKRWVTLHGFSVNVAPDLSHFSGIVPCGISEYGVTSLEALGLSADLAPLDAALGANLRGFLAELRYRDKVP